MGKIYSNQPFKIELTYTELPATAASQQIYYIDPEGTQGHFDALLDTVNKKIYYYSASLETLEIEGKWRFWARIVDALGNIYPGEYCETLIYKEGQ